MDTTIWTVEAVREAILRGNPNLEIVFANYLKAFISRLGDFNINLQDVQSFDSLNHKVIEGINQLEVMRVEFLSVIEMFATSNHPLLKNYLPRFFGNLLKFYEEADINLYSGTSADALRNDHYRFFNQSLFIALTALLLDNQCFDALSAILHTRFRVYNRSYGMLREVNFVRLREYNYTLNEFSNTSSPKRISITADYIYKFAKQPRFEELVKADILLYYISLWNHTEDPLTPYWYPELSVYNRTNDILPHMVSRTYFEKAKILFDVKTVEQYKKLLEETEDTLQRGGTYRVPMLKVGLLYDTVGSIK